jgi:hypothetical protein
MRVKQASLAKDFKSSFLSAEKDQQLIWRKLFVENRPYSDYLKRLLVINTEDCLDESKQQYRDVLKDYSLKKLREDGYLRVVPKLSFGEHEEVKSYIILEFDDYTPSDNPQFRNCVISFTIISHLDYWEMDDYKLRPHQIAGYIDGILDGTKLSGIGELRFLGASQVVLNKYLGGVLLRYVATHEKQEDQNPTLNQ